MAASMDWMVVFLYGCVSRTTPSITIPLPVRQTCCLPLFLSNTYVPMLTLLSVLLSWRMRPVSCRPTNILPQQRSTCLSKLNLVKKNYIYTMPFGDALCRKEGLLQATVEAFTLETSWNSGPSYFVKTSVTFMKK